MKKYSVAINSLVFVLSLAVGILAVNITLKPSSLENLVNRDSVARIITIGQIIQIESDSIIFEYYVEDNVWDVRLQITEDTEFHKSETLIEENIIYGRKVTIAKYSDISVGKRVVIDWEYKEDQKHYVATDIIFVDPDAANLLY